MTAHIAIIGAILWLSRAHLEFDDATDILFIIAPVLAAHTTVVVREFVRTATGRQRTARLRLPFVVISLLFPLAFSAAVVFLITGYVEGFITTAKTLKRAFGGLELAYGAYLGIIVESLFREMPVSAGVPKRTGVSSKN